MPDASLPQLPAADILGAYLRGRAAPGAMQLQQQQIDAGQQEQQMRMLQLAMGQSRLNAANQFDASQQSTQPAGPMLASNGGPPMSPGSPQQDTDPLAALASPQRLAGFAQMGVHNALLSGGDPIKPIQDAMAARAAGLKDQQERAKFALQPAVDEIENIRTADNPEQLVMANPQKYVPVWQKYAPQLGLNPNDPQAMTPKNVRAAATLAHNDVAAQSMGGIAALPMPEELQKVTDKGYSYLTDRSGKPTDIPGQVTPYQRAQLGMERERMNREQAGAKAPSGYEPDPENPGALRAIPGGPADKGAGLDSRQGVMFQRVLSSANAGLNDLKNISELPVGASTGTFGIGASPGHSVFDAGRDALRNKLSGQEVQDYNTMIAGLSRNLSTIETAGLAPNGSITASMDSIMLREGDSGLTKLRKLSQARQIIERGLETNLANPKIPQPQKDIVKNILDGVAQAIPYTQHDITELQTRQNQNPGATLQSMAKEKGLGKAPTTYSDPDKEARYQAWKKAHPNG